MATLPSETTSFLLKALERYVSVPSVNPAFDQASGGEAALAKVVAEDLTEAGFEVHTLHSGAGRDSVVGRLPGTGNGRSLMLYAHLDTVGPGAMADPFRPATVGDRMTGRGVYDMKSGLAGCVTAGRTLATEGGLAGDLYVVAVADEEEASRGIQTVLEEVRTDGAIVTEPTELEVCVAHKGFAWLEVTTRGRAAHGSRFEEGVDANMMMGQVLTALNQLETRVRTGPAHPLLGPGSLHVGTLSGGSALSVYADRCVLGMERRTLPGERPEALLAEVEAMLDRLTGADPRFRAEARLLLAREPFEARSDSDVVRAVRECAQAQLGEPPPIQGATYWMDAAFLAAADIDTVVFGPRGGGAHADVEWVDLRSVEQHCAILIDATRRYCSI